MKIIIKNYILQKAIEEAEKSDHRFKMGAVIFNKKHIISSGHNYGKKSIKHHLPVFRKNLNAVHAEVDAIIKARVNLKGTSILVVRLGYKGKLLLAKPCSYCMSYIEHVGIKNIYFTNNEIERIKL